MSRRAWALVAVWTAPTALFLAITAAVYLYVRIAPRPRLGDEARAEVMRTLRAALQGEDAGAPPPAHPELARGLAGAPLVVGVWLDGRERVRVSGDGATIADAVVAAAQALAVHPKRVALSPAQRTAARLKVDVPAGRGPLVRSFGLAGVSINPGLEGLGVELAGATHVLVPDDLVLAGLVTGQRPFGFLPDVTLGANVAGAERRLAALAGLSVDDFAASAPTIFRFRTDAFVERPAESRSPDAPPLPLYRGLPDGPALTADNLRTAALDGARYLVAHLAGNGRYVYERNLTTGTGTDPSKPGPYSIPRHAGTTYFLAEAYRLTREEFLREPIERAFAHLETLIEAGGCNGTVPDTGAAFECVVDRGQKKAALGSTALTVVALAEYQRATGDSRYLALAERLAAWLLYMQRADGSFTHEYVVARREKLDDRVLLYYSGEAALALVRMHEVTGDPRYLVAAERAIDWLMDFYDFFIGGFLYGEEHWTCIAAAAAIPALQKERWADFCVGYGAFLRGQQPVAGDHPDQRDLVGSYGVTPFVVANNTPSGSRTEAMISAYLLSREGGRPDDQLREQVLAAMRFALRQQIRADNDFAVAADVAGIGHGHGGIPASAIDRTVRIDYVQHICSAMIRSIELLEQ